MFPHGKMYSVNRFRFAEELGTVMPVKKSGSNLGKDRAGEVTAGLDEEVKQTNLFKVAALLFAGYLDAATSMSSSCGGGGSPGSGWGKDKDEDEHNWAIRCAKMAKWLCKPIKRNRSR